MKKRLIATLHNMSHVPPNCVYRGAGKVDYEDDEVIAKELAEPFIHHFAGWKR